MPQIINWGLVREPYNWITVALILAFSGLAIAVLANGGQLPQNQA